LKIKKIIISFLLIYASKTIASDRTLKTTVRTTLCGVWAAGSGIMLKKTIDYSLAHYSKSMPLIITPTKESQTLLAGLGFLGALLVSEKLYYDKTTPFDNILPIADSKTKLRTGKAITVGIQAITAYSILTAGYKLSSVDAGLCTAFSLGTLALLERN